MDVQTGSSETRPRRNWNSNAIASATLARGLVLPAQPRASRAIPSGRGSQAREHLGLHCRELALVPEGANVTDDDRENLSPALVDWSSADERIRICSCLCTPPAEKLTHSALLRLRRRSSCHAQISCPGRQGFTARRCLAEGLGIRGAPIIRAARRPSGARGARDSQTLRYARAEADGRTSGAGRDQGAIGASPRPFPQG